MPTILGVDVDDDLLARWREWFAPEVQPFELSDLVASDYPELVGHGKLTVTPEIRDTFMTYGWRHWALLDQPRFEALPASTRRELAKSQASGQRATWWPDTLAKAGDTPLFTFIELGVPPSQHADVEQSTWERVAPILPEARRLAGTWPYTSGPNCFGTVLAAAGIDGAADEWVLQPAFEAWLAAHTNPFRGTALDDQPGVVYVWRNSDGLAQHACVSIGDGWTLNKPSQAWYSPRVMWPTRVAIRHGGYRGVRVHRYLMHQSTAAAGGALDGRHEMTPPC